MVETFDNLLLLGRPASGKSEFIDFIKNVPLTTRAEKYHIGPFEEMDDFPWIWEKFMEDNLWEAAGCERRYSFGGDNPGLAKKGAPLFDFCIQKINATYVQMLEKKGTLFIEFARGGNDGFRKALNDLSNDILKRACILFIYVSKEESFRRNEARYQEQLKHSILAHKVPDETMNTFYTTHDWLELTNHKESGFLKLQNISVPFVTMKNEPELTDPKLLDQRVGPCMRKLMELKRTCPTFQKSF